VVRRDPGRWTEKLRQHLHQVLPKRLSKESVDMKKSALLYSIVIIFAATVISFTWMHYFSLTQAAHAGENIWTWAGVTGHVSQIETDPLNPDIVYAVRGPSILKSIDSGATWVEVTNSDISGIKKLAMAPGSPNVLFAATESGVYRTNDGGQSWQLVHAAKNTTSLAVSPVDWKEAYIGTTVISKTIDGGETWITVSDSLPNEYTFMNITIAPSAPHILIANPWNTSPYLPWKSTDWGQTWFEMTTAPSNVNTVVFDPKSSNIVYLATISLSWKSSDGGDTWQPMANGLQPFVTGFIIDPDNTQVVHAANGAAGVLESLDAGASWTLVNIGIQGLTVRDIAIGSRKPLKIYASIQGGGIWEMTRSTIQNYSITINDAALFTNQTDVTLTLTAPPGTTEMQISNDGGFGSASWEPFAHTREWTIVPYGDYVIPRTVYAKFRTSGEVSATYQDDIVLDQTPPAGTIQITDTLTSKAPIVTTVAFRSSETVSETQYAVYLPVALNNYLSGFRLVGLLLSATDDVSGVDSMLISNNATFKDAQWQAYTQMVNWHVNEEGTTTVYIKYRDRAGNQSQVYSASTAVP
jgi:photosystem II stability/assembly factor-like uncharacterized protein